MRLALGLAVCVSFIGCSSDRPCSPSDRSWTKRTITVTPSQVNGELGISVRGRWPDATEGLWIRYVLCLRQVGSPDVFLVGSANRLGSFQRTGAGVSDYSSATNFHERIDRNRAYRAVFDYEIWRGEPTKGELLAKDSVWSPEIAPSAPR